jgi:hypothetical protein
VSREVAESITEEVLGGLGDTDVPETVVRACSTGLRAQGTLTDTLTFDTLSKSSVKVTVPL